MPNYFEVTLNNKRFTSKPSGYETACFIRPACHNRIEQLSITELAQYINEGYSYHSSVLDHTLNTKVDAESGEPSKYLNRTCFVPSRTRLFSIDVDHGNMSLDELKTCLTDVPYALIYKTFSYDEQKRRKYRVLFIANRCLESEEEFSYVQSSLIYLFAHPFRERMPELLANDDKVDFSPRDPARVSYAGKVVEAIDRTFDLDQFIEHCRSMDMPHLIQTFVERWKDLVDSQEGDAKSTVPRKRGRTAKSKSNPLRVDTLTLVCDGLAQYGKDHKSELLNIRPEFLDTIGLVNQIPLHELLNEEVYTDFCCYLPDHHDTNPSSNIVIDEKGFTRYYCYGCSGDYGGHSLSTFDFIEVVLLHYNNQLSRYQVIETIFNFLGVEVYSPYQEGVSRFIRENRRFLHNWSLDDPLRRRMERANLITLLRELLDIAEFNAPYKPLSLTYEGDCAYFFVSQRHLMNVMKSRGFVGYSSEKPVNEKFIKLVKAGFLIRIKDKDLDPDFLEESREYRNALLVREFEREGTFTDKRRMDFYIIPSYTIATLQKAEAFYGFEKKHRVLSKNISSKQTTATHGKAFADDVYVQSNNELSKKDLTFIKHLERAADALLTKQGYFTVDQICRTVDPKGNLVKGEKRVDAKTGEIKKTSAKNARLRKVNTFLPHIELKMGLDNHPVNKKLRALYNIPDSVLRNKVIYFKKETEQ